MTLCQWCRASPVDERLGRFCTKKCRQTAHRLRRRRGSNAFGPSPTPGRFAYADPPYVGKARLYRDQASYAGEVDHAALVASLVAGNFDGWALSAGADSLRAVLPVCPEGARVLPWVKPNGVSGSTLGAHNTWEPLIVVGGRCAPPGIPDWLAAKPARGGGDLIGRKPIAFCAFLFDQLGMIPGDELVDLFPGTGIVLQAWQYLTRKRVQQLPFPLLTPDGQRIPLLPSRTAERRQWAESVAEDVFGDGVVPVAAAAARGS